MHAQSIPSPVAFLTVVVTVAAFLCPVRLAGSEVAATHLVYEKAVKMKKIDAFLYLPFLDQSRKSDSPQRDRRVHCAVFGQGKSGPLSVSGKFRLRLLGETTRTGEPWESRVLLGPIDANGEASFESAEIRGLVDAATDAGVKVELFGVGFDGGKGGKVAALTMDCLHQGAGS